MSYVIKCVRAVYATLMCVCALLICVNNGYNECTNPRVWRHCVRYSAPAREGDSKNALISAGSSSDVRVQQHALLYCAVRACAPMQEEKRDQIRAFTQAATFSRLLPLCLSNARLLPSSRAAVALLRRHLRPSAVQAWPLRNSGVAASQTCKTSVVLSLTEIARLLPL